MTATETVIAQIAFAVIFVILIAYLAGRVHQWYRHTFERDVAYREGYNQASRTLFHLTTRRPPGKAEAKPVTSPSATPATRVRAVVPFHPIDPHRSPSDRSWHAEHRGTDTQEG